MENIVIATIKSWNIQNAKEFQQEYKNKYNVKIITDKNEFATNEIINFDPKYIFFPHWSWIIPKEIWSKFKCIIFHPADLPFGRGGTPVQNLIKRKIYKTKISALVANGELDAGPILTKIPFMLSGSAESIYKRFSKKIFQKMIPNILNIDFKPHPQKGKAMVFKRLKPEKSQIGNNITLDDLYDHVRMLDAEGYPLAFLKLKNLLIKFKNVKKRNHELTADVIISNNI
jgi:methionyl-tRNA formyltransferase